MSDWEEIKRLAADFQRTQTSDTLQKLSERNVIDIIKKLTDLSLIELVYTCDGKEFITPDHLTKEIEDEIYINGGRMQIHDLATKLNVDYQHVENIAKKLNDERPGEYNLVLGQIIHSTYKVTLGKLINDKMLTDGQLSIADFSKSLDLPSEFLSSIVEEILPTVLDDYIIGQDGKTYYTTDTMDRFKSIIVGTFSAILKPTSLASIMKRLDIPERIFTPIVDGLIKDGRLDAHIENRTFIPAIYSREQNDWINKFYKANNYIEYDVLSRMDIKQPKVYMRKNYPDGIQLKSCFMSQGLLSQVEYLIEDCISSNNWIDISTIVPSAIESEDIELMLTEIFKINKQISSSCLIFDKINVCSPGFINSCRNSLSKLMESRAQEQLQAGVLVDYFMGDTAKKVKNVVQPKEEEVESSSANDKENPKDDPIKDTLAEDTKDDEETEQGGKKSKGKKSGGGFTGREIRQKAVKKKYIPGNKKGGDMSDEEVVSTKGPRSNKGRAARRGISPEPEQRVTKSKNPQTKPDKPRKEPLIFMNNEQLINRLRLESRDGSDEFLQSIAASIESDLNQEYEALAKRILEEFLKKQSEQEGGNGEDAVVDLVE